VAADMSSAFAHLASAARNWKTNWSTPLLRPSNGPLQTQRQDPHPLPARHRLSTKGDKPKALAAFQQFISYQANGTAADDARSRIEVVEARVVIYY